MTSAIPIIHVVDDDASFRRAVARLLTASGYTVQTFSSADEFMSKRVSDARGCALVDLRMPGPSGLELQDALVQGDNPLPVIFLTAKVGAEDEEMGLAMGAVDFIHKPIATSVVLARVRTHLQIRHWQTFLEDKSAWLQQEVESRVSEVFRLQEATIRVMVSLAEFRDECTGNHIRRTQDYVRLLADYLSRQPRDAGFLTPEQIDRIAKASPLHDIGKIGIPDHILLKPGRHTPEEFAIMQTHSVKGESMLLRSLHEMGGDNAMLRFACQIARSHHERWDGGGYPDGLAGEAIPLAARLMAVADVYDALRSRRPYKKAFDHAEAVDIIVQGKGSHFDPLLVEAFLALEGVFSEIATKLADE